MEEFVITPQGWTRHSGGTFSVQLPLKPQPEAPPPPPKKKK
jgi:hypothetical protein